MIKELAIVVAVVAMTILLVIVASTSFGVRPLRLYDYGPPLAAGVVAVIALLLDARKES
ncbi:hypothetical protein HTY52_11510 [Cupriavidus taiwanensis]|uniref:hypothetical protein n=1 Tax=Cupriavidus taiwanensis TaxID=164546 RepID=UPI0015740DFA|nr:hypothetical protein [Cupriavidus taiwanensis]NSX14698.1 hypothetical protein [Cupriavidus taiwanensis]